MNTHSKPICDTDPSRRGGIDLNAVTQADEGWIEWAGGEDVHDQPIPDGARIEVQFRSGIESETDAPEHFAWDHCGAGSDIIAYRVVKS